MQLLPKTIKAELKALGIRASVRQRNNEVIIISSEEIKPHIESIAARIINPNMGYDISIIQ